MDRAREIYQQSLLRTEFDNSTVLGLFHSAYSNEACQDVFLSLLKPYQQIISHYNQTTPSSESSSSSSSDLVAPQTATSMTHQKLRECLLQLEMRLEIARATQRDPPLKAYRQDIIKYAGSVSIITEARHPGEFAEYLEDVLFCRYRERLPRTMRVLFKHFEFAVPETLRRATDIKTDALLYGTVIMPIARPAVVDDDEGSQQQEQDQLQQEQEELVKELVEEPALVPVETTRLLSESVSPLRLGHFVSDMNALRRSNTIVKVVTRPRQKVRVKRRRSEVSSSREQKTPAATKEDAINCSS